MMRIPMRALQTSLLVAAAIAAAAAEPKLKPRHDPPEQLFRRAPMAESARSIAVNVSTNLHYAFDPDLGRIHSIWLGEPLNLWGPPYSNAKTPFICNFDGPAIYSFPQVSQWWLDDKPIPIRFRRIETSRGYVRLSYNLIIGPERVWVDEELHGGADTNNWQFDRRFEFAQGCPRAISFLAFAERGATIKKQQTGIEITSTNGVSEWGADLSNGNPVVWTFGAEQVDYQSFLVTEQGTETGFKPSRIAGEETRARVHLPKTNGWFAVTLYAHHGTPSASAEPHEPAPKTFSAAPDFRAPDGDDSYKIEHFPLPSEAELLITGMDWMPNRDLAVCTWLGQIYFVQNATGAVRQATYKRFASGLAEPLGLAVASGEIYVVQKGELTGVSGSKDVANTFECINSSWGFSGNYHSFSFGPLITPQGDAYVFIAGQRGLYDLPYQGWALQFTGDWKTTFKPFCSGLRVPHGWGLFHGEVFVTDNQGNWIGACRLNHLQENRFYGFPSSKPAPKALPKAEDVEPPVLWFPRSLAPSASGFDVAKDDRFGPFKDQLFIGDFQNSIVMRACLEKVNGRWQGAVFPFAKGFLSWINRLSFGPDGKLYVGGGKRVWSTAAPKEASLDRVSFTGKVPFEVQRVHATSNGFELVFTKALDPKSAGEAANYLVKQFNYKYQQEYGSPEFDHEGKVGASEMSVTKVQLLADGVTARLAIPQLRAGYVTSFQVAVSSQSDEDLRNDTFYYTLNAQPRNDQ